MYNIKLLNGKIPTYLWSYCCKVMWTTDIKEACVFDNKRKINSFYKKHGYKECTEIINAKTNLLEEMK